MIAALPPAAILLAAALLIALLPARARPWIGVAAPLLALAHVWSLPDGAILSVGFLERTLAVAQLDALSRVFATIFAMAAAAGALFAAAQRSAVEAAAVQVYAGSAIGVVCAGDLISLFVFWEGMAIASTVAIWSAGTEAAYRASMRYLAIHLFGGVVLMAGIAGLAAETGSIAFGAMAPNSLATWAILIGFLVNVGAPPLQAWVADAYPEASWSGTVFLSAFTTKAAVYVLARGFPGAEILIPIGLAMAFYGIVYALLENDVRRLLAYSIVSQVGFMVTGVGIGTPLALNGVAAHAFAHIAYKALLLMTAGAALYATGRSRADGLGGLARAMPLAAGCAVVGAASIAAMPLTSGFVSKSMIVSAAAGEHLTAVWFLLTAAAALTALYAGFRFPWLVFFRAPNVPVPLVATPPLSMQAAMVAMAALCLAIGLAPEHFYALLPFAADYAPYTGDHVASNLQIALAAGLAFVLLRGRLGPSATRTLDLDWLYRGPGRCLYRALADQVGAAVASAYADVAAGATRIGRSLRRSAGAGGMLSRTEGVGTMVGWVTVLLAAYLIFHFV